MAGVPKRKGSASQALSAIENRGRWEDEVATPPSESSPTTALISGGSGHQINGGSFTVIGNSTSIQNNYYNQAPQTTTADILGILRTLPLPNFRDMQLDAVSKATDGTCIWFTSGELFVFWIKKGKILWGIGIRMSFHTFPGAQRLTNRTSWSREDCLVVSGFDKALICELT
jgi:hypothetical protein